MHMRKLILITSALAIMHNVNSVADDFNTVTEKNDFRITSSYAETVDFYRRLEKVSPYAKLLVIGQTPQRRDLHCLVVSKEKAFTPDAAKKTGKVILLVQNGIHSGEIDGKDASMILLREILVTKERESSLDSVILLVIPIFNADGHENNTRYTRSNQYGPENAGFRTTAQRFNLNRDYMKIDAPEMRAWIKLWTTWMPDFFIDNHVTDGHDWQYVITYTMPWHPNAAAQVRNWTNEVFDPYFIPRCTELGFPPFPYAFPIHDHPNDGISTFVDIPRFSTGYTALWNRPGLLIEMHSLKDYRPRVLGNHAAMVAVLEVLNKQASSLKRAVAEADAATLRGLTDPVPLTYDETGDSTFVPVLNYRVSMDSSTITGGKYPRWDHAMPQTDTVPYFSSFRAEKSASVPRAYIIPREWTHVIERLRWHGVKVDTLAKASTLDVELYRLDSVKFARESFEAHVRVSYKAMSRDTTLEYPAGTVVIDTRQLAAKVVVNALEPNGPDCFLSWGLMNTVLEQKEYGEGYIVDPLADSMYATDAKFRAAFDSTVAADTAFARNTSAKRDFFYKRSRFAEAGYNWYPVARLKDAMPATAPWKGGL